MDLTGIGTLVLAATTVAATVVNLRLWQIDRKDRSGRDAELASASAETTRENRITALRQLYEVVDFFKLRVETRRKTAMTDATALLHGCDACLSAALGDSVTRSLSPELAKPVYEAVFGAYGVLAKAVYRRPELERHNQIVFQDINDSAAKAEEALANAAVIINSEVLRLLPKENSE